MPSMWIRLKLRKNCLQDTTKYQVTVYPPTSHADPEVIELSEAQGVPVRSARSKVIARTRCSSCHTAMSGGTSLCFACFRQLEHHKAHCTFHYRLGACCICSERECKAIILPCGHVSTCMQCTRAILQRSEPVSTCPICRGHILDFREFKLSCN